MAAALRPWGRFLAEEIWVMRSFWADRRKATACAALALGLALRAVYYLRDPALWHDELYVVYNLLHKGFGELLGPLTFHQAAPPLFLWLEKAALIGLGDSTYALRLPAFAASCVGLCLLGRAAPNLVHRRAVPWAIFFIACSDSVLWHSCEVKPYTFDVLAAALLVWLHTRWRDRPVAYPLIGYAALAPVLLGLSYSTAFLYGGLLLALLPSACRQGRGARAAYAAAVAVAALTLAVLALGPMRAQRTDALLSYWKDLHHFPPWHRPWSVPLWAAVSSLEIGRYCFKPAGQILIGLAAAGGVRLARRQGGAAAVLLAAPSGLALVAALAGVYPYGGSRLHVYAAPALALLAAEAVPVALVTLGRTSRPAKAALVILLLLPAWPALGDALGPAPRADSARAAAYVAGRLRSHDRVAGTNPESLYYFRALGASYTAVGEPSPLARPVAPVPTVPGGRLWLLVRGDRLTDRLALAPARFSADERLPLHAGPVTGEGCPAAAGRRRLAAGASGPGRGAPVAVPLPARRRARQICWTHAAPRGMVEPARRPAPCPAVRDSEARHVRSHRACATPPGRPAAAATCTACAAGGNTARSFRCRPHPTPSASRVAPAAGLLPGGRVGGRHRRAALRLPPDPHPSGGRGGQCPDFGRHRARRLPPPGPQLRQPRSAGDRPPGQAPGRPSAAAGPGRLAGPVPHPSAPLRNLRHPARAASRRHLRPRARGPPARPAPGRLTRPAPAV